MTIVSRIHTPWDWRQEFSLKGFEGSPAMPPRANRWSSGRPWSSGGPIGASSRSRVNVEIRWSHVRFRRMPEAKVYLDTPHNEVPGYAPLDADDLLSRGLRWD